MAGWGEPELAAVGGATELEVATLRRDGSLSRYVTIWVVRAGDALYIRSAYGPENPWYRRAVSSSRGRIRAGGVERDVTFTAPPAETHTPIDAAYHAKYDHYGPAIVGTIVGSDAATTTLRLDPSD